MANIQMEFKRGDVQNHYFQLPADSWTAGGTLWFTVKPAVDNDTSDAAAIIDKSFDDTFIVGETHELYLAGFVTYELRFLPNDTDTITFEAGKKTVKGLGEFQYVRTAGQPETFPGGEDYIDVVIHADIKRGGV